jgi:hypothetical protein
MEVEEAQELRRQWGSKPCDHPGYSKEYYRGSQTGDYVCSQCGRTLRDEQVEAIKKTRD